MGLHGTTIQSLAGALVVAVALVVAGVAAPTHAAGKRASATANKSPQPDRRWIKHKVVPSETLDAIATRYGVTRAEVVRWNAKAVGSKQWIYAGQKLRVYARVVPPPRKRIRYEVKFGDTWNAIAARYNVPVSDLRDWNTKIPRQFKAGQTLTVYTNPRQLQAPAEEEEQDLEAAILGIEGLPRPAPLPSVPEVHVRPGGMSVGHPNRGKLINAVQLPQSELYTIRDGDDAWGSSHAVEIIQRSIADFRARAGYGGQLYIGAMSKRSGGRFRPHRSHQSGRDVDIRLPKKRGVSTKSADPGGIDWAMSWELVRSFIATGEAEYIFLDYGRQKRLWKAAKAAGATRAEIAKAIQYPRSRSTNNGVVRHAKGHLVHIHVRIKCAANNSRCSTR